MNFSKLEKNMVRQSQVQADIVLDMQKWSVWRQNSFNWTIQSLQDRLQGSSMGNKQHHTHMAYISAITKI